MFRGAFRRKGLTASTARIITPAKKLLRKKTENKSSMAVTPDSY
jgi:hypothetical protein